MSRLFIRIVDGQPFEHPIFEDNFIQAFPEIDIDNLPEGYAEFKRVDQPSVGIYEVYEGVTYQLVDGFYTDVHQVRGMTAEEKSAKQQAVKDSWAENGYASWVFDEDSCSFHCPLAQPDDGNEYRWDEEAYQSDNTQGWVLVTPPE